MFARKNLRGAMTIEKNEIEIRCTVSLVGSRAEYDPACKRINMLIHNYLQKIGSSADGWDILHRDPADGRYWELTYPHSEVHGGGPPLLTWLSVDQARSKYGSVISGPP
jgi:hypothetical protein